MWLEAGTAVSTFGFLDVCSEAFEGALCLLDSAFLRSGALWLVVGSVDFGTFPDDDVEALVLFDVLSPRLLVCSVSNCDFGVEVRRRGCETFKGGGTGFTANLYPIIISSSITCRGSPSTCDRFNGNEELDSAAEEATANADKGDDKQRKCDVRSIDAACLPGVEAISARLHSKTGNDGVQGKIMSARSSVDTERFSFHPGSDQFSLDFVGGTKGNTSAENG